MEQLTLFAAEALANPSASQESGNPCKANPGSCLSLSEQFRQSVRAFCYGRTFRAASQQRDLKASAGALSGSSCVNWGTSGIALHGEYWTRNSSEYPKDAAVSFLSEVLETNAPPKYCLSLKACEGIISRAKRNGKSLPPLLEEALTEYMTTLSSCGTPEARTSGGGSGPLVQTDVSATLATGQDQTLLTFSKTHRGMSKDDYTGYERSECAATLNCFDTGESRANEIVCMADTQANTSITEGNEAIGSLTRHNFKDPPVICMASDTSNAAIDNDLCGTIHVGGGVPCVITPK